MVKKTSAKRGKAPAAAPAPAVPAPTRAKAARRSAAPQAAPLGGGPALRNRVKEVVTLRGADVVTMLHRHPYNPKTHTDPQREAMRGVLQEVGIAGVFMARRDAAGQLHIYDGHMRQDEIPRLDPNAEVTVVVTDLTAEEADKAILTFDYMSELAEKNKSHIDALMQRVRFQNAGAQQLMQSLALSAQTAAFAPRQPRADRAAAAGDAGDPGPQDTDAPGGAAATGVPASAVRVVYLFLNAETHPQFMLWSEALANVLGKDNTTDTVFEVLREAYQDRCVDHSDD